MMRAIVPFLLAVSLAAPAGAQTAQEGQMRLYITELEERIRQLTGENERLAYEVGQLRAQLGLPPLPARQAAAGAALPADAFPVASDDPLVRPDGATGSAPVDLSTLAGGMGGGLADPGLLALPAGGEPFQTAGLPQAPTMSLSGSARDEYDLAYGYVLTGDYGLAEDSFKSWIAAFPNDPQMPDAQFWLGESHLQQGEYRDAANAFLAVYKTNPDSAKGPDALLKLGLSLSALGEAAAACATLAEVGRRYPQASQALMSRVREEENRAGC